MKHVNVLLEKIYIPSDLVEAISADTLPEDFDQRVESYNKSRIDYFKATPEFKAMEKQIGDRTYEGAVLKHVKRFNTTLNLGLTNPEMESIKSIDEFTEKVKAYLSEKEQKLINSSDATLRADLEKYKGDVSKYATENQELLSKFDQVKAQAEAEKETAINLFKAETLFHKMVSEDKKLPNIEGQDFIINAIKTGIFSEYIVKPDGTVLAKDGGSAMHPEKGVIITKLEDVYEYYKNKAGLVIKSNAGSAANGQPGASGGSNISPELAAKMDELFKARTK